MAKKIRTAMVNRRIDSERSARESKIVEDLQLRISSKTILEHRPGITYDLQNGVSDVQKLLTLERLRLAAIRCRRTLRLKYVPLTKLKLQPFDPSVELEFIQKVSDQLPIRERIRFTRILKKELIREYRDLIKRIENDIQGVIQRLNPENILSLSLNSKREVLSVLATVFTECVVDADTEEDHRRFPLLRESEKTTIREIFELLEDFYSQRRLKSVLAPDSELFHRNLLKVSFGELSGAEWLDVRVNLNKTLLFDQDRCSEQTQIHSVEKLIEPAVGLNEVILNTCEKEDIETFVQAYKRRKIKDLSFLFFGPSGVGKTTLAHAIARELGKKVVVVSAEGLSEKDLPAAISFLITKYRKSQVLILFDECEALWYERFSLFINGNRNSAEQSTLKKILENLSGCVAFVSNCSPPAAFKRRVTYCLEIGSQDLGVRTRIFKNRIESLAKVENANVGLAEEEYRDLAQQYDLSGGFLNQAIALSALKGNGIITKENLTYSLERIAKTVGFSQQSNAPVVQIKDLVLSEGVIETLNRIVTYNKRKTLNSALDPLMPPGITILLEGPSGVGKTVVAEALAREMGLRFKLVTPSSFLSKYVGESEVAISRAFAEAENGGYLLFLDEAEGMLGQRSEESRSWETTQIDEFLKRIEMFKGVFVAATNHKEMMDHAFARRFLFHLKFEYPCEKQRFEYLAKHLGSLIPSEAITNISSRHVLSFGELRNAIVIFKTYPCGDVNLFNKICSEQLLSRFQRPSTPIGLRASNTIAN